MVGAHMNIHLSVASIIDLDLPKEDAKDARNATDIMHRTFAQTLPISLPATQETAIKNTTKIASEHHQKRTVTTTSQKTTTVPTIDPHGQDGTTNHEGEFQFTNKTGNK